MTLSRTLLALALLGALGQAPAAAQQKKKAAGPAPGSSGADGATTTDAQGRKQKSYNFTGLDIDGKLKTPQLLYFLNRMKSEFDSTAPDKRSFLPELEASTSQM